MAEILVVDDDPTIAELLQALMERQGHQVEMRTDALDALDLVKTRNFDLVLTDLMMPMVSGLEIAQEVLSRDADTLVLMVTGHASLETALSAIRLGVYDYILKPFKLDEVEHAVDRALENKTLKSENRALRHQLAQQEGRWELVGKSNAMEDIKARILRAAPAPSTVLISGESGTGKELAARAIHQYSSRGNRPFIWVNCGAIPENLLESELFGHKKGAFTDASSDRIGHFAQAHGGTLFLDEIGLLPLPLQVKLLRVLQEREIRPLGSNQTQKVDVRIVAATNADLWQMVQKGAFREDLYYRLKVISLVMPPLRDRLDDLPLLVHHFLNKHAKILGLPFKPFSRSALTAMQNYDWPGNVRELENVVESCLAMSVGNAAIEASELPSQMVAHPKAHTVVVGDAIWDLNQALSEFEKTMILRALKETHGVKAKAAELLQVKRTTLVEKLKRYPEISAQFK
ncbi:MAG: sigma-54-dependent Fis family transcriptional regulator [Acidobacteria bacterium]|nr:sigma-54-dependent Fis family transcriptional regulator [Acidobacteriota bacterium]MCB9398167.1 sigma-54-dependent Fis family transcriptional regulator [Acidobacteriota bacterium]